MSRVLCAALLGALAMTGGCFKPDHPACAFSCATPPHTCPQGFVCGADNLCHDPNSTGLCSIILIDAGQDEAAAETGDTGDTAPREAGPETASDTGPGATDARSDAPSGG